MQNFINKITELTYFYEITRLAFIGKFNDLKIFKFFWKSEDFILMRTPKFFNLIVDLNTLIYSNLKLVAKS